MGRFSIRLKITIWFTAALVVIVLFAYLMIFVVSRQILIKTIQDSLVETVENNVDEIEYFSGMDEIRTDADIDYLIDYRKGYLEIDDDFLSKVNEVYTGLYDEKSRLIYGENPIAAKVADLEFVDSEIQKVMKDGTGYYIFDRKLTAEGLNGLWLRGVVSEEQGERQSFGIMRIALVLLPVLVVIASAGGYFIAGRTLNPIQKIAGTARKIGEEGQEEQLYLDVKYRKLWFRLVNPAGKIISRIITFTENMAVVEARIYLDKCDQEDNYVANSFSQKFRSDDPKFGDKFLEMAETAAVGRALSDAGYGVQFADVGEENDPAQVDAGIPYQNPQMPDSGAMENAAMPDSGVMPNAPMPTYGEMPGQPEYAGQQMMNQFYQQAQAAGSTIYHGSGQMPGYGSAPAASTPPKTGQMLQGALQNLDTSLPVEELMKHMNYEMAVGTVIPGKGKYGGKTMGQVAVESPSTIQWFAEQYSGPNNLVPAAAKVILQKAMPMAG